MFRILFPPTLFVVASLVVTVAFQLVSCSSEKSSHSDLTKTETPKRISKIKITEFGRTTTLDFSYDKNVVNIEFHPSNGNVEARIELNDQNKAREIIAGTSHIQYLYDEKGREIGVFSDKGMQQIMFDYEGENISAQHTIQGNDTVVTFRYNYENEVPKYVEIESKFTHYRKYELTYSEVENPLSGFNEMILPAEFSSLLGIPAMYGKNYLLKALRIDTGANDKEPLKESYVPKYEVVEFDISKAGKQEVIKLVSDGSRQWQSILYW